MDSKRHLNANGNEKQLNHLQAYNRRQLRQPRQVSCCNAERCGSNRSESVEEQISDSVCNGDMIQADVEITVKKI